MHAAARRAKDASEPNMSLHVAAAPLLHALVMLDSASERFALRDGSDLREPEPHTLDPLSTPARFALLEALASRAPALVESFDPPLPRLESRLGFSGVEAALRQPPSAAALRDLVLALRFRDAPVAENEGTFFDNMSWFNTTDEPFMALPFMDFVRALRKHSDAVPLLVRAIVLGCTFASPAEVAKLRAAVGESAFDSLQNELSRTENRCCNTLRGALALLLGELPVAQVFQPDEPTKWVQGTCASKVADLMRRQDDVLKKDKEKKEPRKGKGAAKGGKGGGGEAAAAATEGSALLGGLDGCAMHEWADVLLPLSNLEQDRLFELNYAVFPPALGCADRSVSAAV